MQERRSNKSTQREIFPLPTHFLLPFPLSPIGLFERAREGGREEGKDESPKVGYKRKGKRARRLLLSLLPYLPPSSVSKVGQSEHVTQHSPSSLPPLILLPSLTSSSQTTNDRDSAEYAAEANLRETGRGERRGSVVWTTAALPTDRHRLGLICDVQKVNKPRSLFFPLVQNIGNLNSSLKFL